MSTTNINSLFSDAADEGVLGQDSMSFLTAANLDQQINAALGINVASVTASEVVLVSMLIDDSVSMKSVEPAGRAARSNRPWIDGQPLVRDGHNGAIQSLRNSKQSAAVLVSCRYLSGTVLYPYVSLADAKAMDDRNYVATLGHTPLYAQSIVLLGQVIAKAQEFRGNGVPVRTITLILTDGGNNDAPHTPDGVAVLVKDMLAQENHIISGMGLGEEKFFRNIFTEMGLRDEWILTPGTDEHKMREAWGLWSQSAVRASQNAGSFSKTSQTGVAGGFS